MSDGSEQLPTNPKPNETFAEQSILQPSDTTQLCLPAPRPDYNIFPGIRPAAPGAYQKFVQAKRKAVNGKNHYTPGGTRSKSPKVRKRAARIKPLPDTPATRELKELMGRVNQAIQHGMLSKHGIVKQREKCGRRQIFFPGLPMKEAAALLNLKPASLSRTLQGRMLPGTRTLVGLAELTGMRMEQFTRLYDLRQQVEQDIRQLWERRSLLIRDGLKNRMVLLGHQGQPGWLSNSISNPALRYKASQPKPEPTELPEPTEEIS